MNGESLRVVEDKLSYSANHHNAYKVRLPFGYIFVAFCYPQFSP